MKFASATDKQSRTAAFTLAEVLAALLFMAIVIPVAVEALHVASLSGEVAARRSEAYRVADAVLNESIVTTNWMSSTQSGSTFENSHQYHWTLSNEPWQQDSSMQMLTAEVTFSAGGREQSIRLKTLAASPTATAGTTATGMQ
jgi:type II secretory pathway pseudopilin PulG